VRLQIREQAYNMLSALLFATAIVLQCRHRPRSHAMNEQLLSRITTNQGIFGGKPIIRNMRISVESILGLLAQGETIETVLADFPDLTREDIQACLAYAHAVVAHDSLDAVQVARH
jgi:uncharacterized protein (DUF433 family)